MSYTYPEKQSDKQDAAEVKNYTRIPNMLIFDHDMKISPQEKWLYVCLKHLCGRQGTRHLSLRYISEQTGISVGALSSSKDKAGKVNEGMIRHLHDAGLIHSEIKKPGGKGNAQYHITITDVWGLNQDFFAARPKFGQEEKEESSPSEIRTDSNTTCPESEQARPDFGQTCPKSITIPILESKITLQDFSSSSSIPSNPQKEEEEGEEKIFSQQEPPEQEWGPEAALDLANTYRLSPYTPEERAEDLPFAQQYCQMHWMDSPKEGLYTREKTERLFKSAYAHDDLTGHGPWLDYPELTFYKLVKKGFAKTTSSTLRQKENQQKNPATNGKRQGPETPPKPATRQSRDTVKELERKYQTPLLTKGYGHG